VSVLLGQEGVDRKNHSKQKKKKNRKKIIERKKIERKSLKASVQWKKLSHGMNGG
jgi:hypothetical protein